MAPGPDHRTQRESATLILASSLTTASGANASISAVNRSSKVSDHLTHSLLWIPLQDPGAIAQIEILDWRLILAVDQDESSSYQVPRIHENAQRYLDQLLSCDFLLIEVVLGQLAQEETGRGWFDEDAAKPLS